MKINQITQEEIFHALVTSEKGLTEQEAAKRLLEFGPNEIETAKRIPLSIRFLKQFTHFLAILLWVGAGLALVSEVLHPGEGMLTLGLAIIGVIVINAVFTFVQEYRAEKSIAALQRLLPFDVKVIRDGKSLKIPSREVVPGDLIQLTEGDRIPADARIINGADPDDPQSGPPRRPSWRLSCRMMVNNAPLTGESEPILLNDEISSGELLESRNIAFAGTSVVSGSGMAVVFATGMRTEVGGIAHLTSGVETELSPLQKEIVRVSRVIAILATLMGGIFFLIGHVIGMTFWENFLFAVGIIVANVPEGLLPTVTLSLAMGSQRMAKKKALIKTLTSVETLGAVTVICTDKTGTLTQNRMAVRKLWFEERILEPEQLRDLAVGPLLRIAALCNNARFLDGKYQGDPTEIALLKTARETLGDFHAERIAEIPFDSDRARMSTVNRIHGRPWILTKGALEGLLPLCSHEWRNGEAIPLEDHRKRRLTEACQTLMDQGLRVLAFACREVGENLPTALNVENVEKNLYFTGLMGLDDPPRPEVPEALSKCRSAGIKVIMMTGDGARTARAIAREIGLVGSEPVIIEGSELAGMSDGDLCRQLSEREVIFARMAPKHKMRVVSVLMDEGQRVAVTGDGVNDAPALKKADIGIAMGITGTDVAKEAADMILLDDNFATIVQAIEEGRAVYENIRKFISYILSSNVPEIVPYLAFVLLRIPLPLTVIQILAIDLGTDMFPALALGAEKPTKDLMRQPPRDPKERLLNSRLLMRAYLFLGPIEAAAGLFGFFYVLNAGGWSWGSPLAGADALYRQATTACLTAIIITQVANVFACRSFNLSVFRIGFFSNRLIFIGIAFELLLQVFIVYHPWGNEIFATAPISGGVWLALIPFAIILWVAEEGRKGLTRVWNRQDNGKDVS